MRSLFSLSCSLLIASNLPAADILDKGEVVALDRAVPANERGVMCLTSFKGTIYGGTTGRAAHLFQLDTATGEAKSVVRLDGGVGFAHQLIALPDGSLIGGTQADPTGIAVKTDPKAVGHLYRFHPAAEGVKVVDLGVPVAGQGIYALAFDDATQNVVGLTWPDGHFFSHDAKGGTTKDHGAIAGYRTFETPRHAEDLNRHGTDKVHYPRQVSRAIIVSKSMAYTGGADGLLYRFDCKSGKIEKTTLRLPATRGRESWASIDAAVLAGDVAYGGTSDGYLFELRLDKAALRSFGKPLGQGGIQGLVAVKNTIHGIGGEVTGVPRSFTLTPEPFSLEPGMLVHAANAGACMDGFGALVLSDDGAVYAGERDRIARLIRFGGKPIPKKTPVKKPLVKVDPASLEKIPSIDFRVAFAPGETTTDGSGYTALEVGKDGKAYVGAARYGGYATLLRLDPKAKPAFMEKVANMRDLSGEDRNGINTQGKIHSKILVGADGRIWFATKQAHEIFETRPEYGEDRDGFPGGHLCFYDPKTGFARSLGILMKQEGLVGGAIDDARSMIYHRSEPKNHFLSYDLKSGRTRDRGNVGASGRYMTMDKSGGVYTVGRDRYLCRYDPTTGYVEDLAIKVEGDGGYLAPYVIAVGPNGKLYGVAAGHNSVMEFDIDKIKAGPFPEVTMRNIAPAAPAGFPVDDIHAAVFGKDGKLYYPLNTTDPGNAKGARKTLLIVMRFDPQTKKSEPVGIPKVIDFDEEKVKHSYNRGAKFELRYMQGAAIADDGTLFLLGIYPQLHVAWFDKLTRGK